MKKELERNVPLLVLILELAVGTLLTVVIAVIFWMISATLGGNGYIVFSYAGLIGYESAGMLGSIVGSWIGALLGCWLIAWRYGHPPVTWRTVGYPAFFGCVIMLFIFSFSTPRDSYQESMRIIAVERILLFVLPPVTIVFFRRLIYFYTRLFGSLK